MNEEKKTTFMVICIEEMHPNHLRFTRYSDPQLKIHYMMRKSKVPYEKLIPGNYYLVLVEFHDNMFVWDKAFPFNMSEEIK